MGARPLAGPNPSRPYSLFASSFHATPSLVDQARARTTRADRIIPGEAPDEDDDKAREA